jgi:hypothetical protein
MRDHRICRHAAILLAALLPSAPAWAQVPAGLDFRVSAATTLGQVAPGILRTVGVGRDGDFVVVWQGRPGGPTTHLDVYGRRFAADGSPRGATFQVNTSTTYQQFAPTVAADARGNFVVVWVSSMAAGNIGGIMGQRYAADGATRGSEFRANTVLAGSPTFPAIAMDPAGNFVVAWSSLLDGNGSGVFARRFDSAGAPNEAEFQVNSYTTGSQGSPSATMDAAGNFIVTWASAGQDGSDLGVYAQRFDRSGVPRGSEFRVNTYTTDRQERPSIDADAAGDFIISWSSSTQDGDREGIFAQRYDAAGAAQGPEFRVNTYTTSQQTNPSVASDDVGNFIIAWTSFVPAAGVSTGFGQRFDRAGQARGVEFQLSSFTTATSFGSVASDPVGNFVGDWQSADASGVGVFARRFGGLGPAALVVDSAGNRVLEPGETVDVRPSWRNVNGATQTFSGSLADITGPAGATYTITDAAGDYGTVADGGTAPCADCYAVWVSNPSVRPDVHWDASVVESIIPDAQGQQKQWLLHVGRSFSDVPASNGFYRFVETLLHHGVTGGCTATEHCPSNSSTRAQMAVFVLVAKEGTGYAPPACTTPVFADVPASSPFCRWIEELARRGVVGGCGGGNYCPGSPVTREQMAVFVLRTLDPTLNPPACTTPLYNDVPASSPFCRWIEELTRRAVVTGCGGGNYCPTAPVTREQMGAFISATFGLNLYGP